MSNQGCLRDLTRPNLSVTKDKLLTLLFAFEKYLIDILWNVENVYNLFYIEILGNFYIEWLSNWHGYLQIPKKYVWNFGVFNLFCCSVQLYEKIIGLHRKWLNFQLVNYMYILTIALEYNLPVLVTNWNTINLLHELCINTKISNTHTLLLMNHV